MEPIEKTTIIGQRIPKPDGPDKAVGRTTYINDMVLPMMLYGKILHAGRPHARIKSINLRAAKALPGVHVILTADDIPELRFGVNRDNTPLKGGKVRCVRDEVAAVAAETEEICDQAVALIEVDYEDLPGVYDPAEALKEGAPVVHDEKPDNKSLAYKFDHGDLAEAESVSDIILDDVFNVHYVTHCCMGTGCVLADFDPNGKLTIYSQTQYPYNFKMDLALALGIHPGDIRVIQPPVGGAFGSKLDVYPFEPVCALLAKASLRPVKLMFDRQEEFVNAPTRQPVRIHLRTGAKADGTLTFRDADCLLNNGAYTSWGPTTPFVMMRTFTSHYRVPTIKCRFQSAYTNNPYAGSFRGYGNVQATYATATHMDMLAEKLGMNLLELSLKNAQESGEISPQGSRLNDLAFAECLEIAAAKTNFVATVAKNESAREKPGRIKRGIGLASSIHNAGGAKIHKSDGCGTILKLDDFARCTVITGASEIGQGIDAVICQVISEELGIPVSDITLVNNDSAIGPWDVGVHASRTTFVAGNSAQRAANAARQQILAAASRESNVACEFLDLRSGWVVQADNGEPVVKLDKLLRNMHFQKEPELVMTTDYYEPPSEPENAEHVGDMSAAYSHAVHVAEVEVDTETGEVKVIKVTSVQDVGRIINELGLEAQIEGGIVMGLGYALSEELRIVEGHVTNPCFRDYKVPTAPEIPELELHFVETDSKTGPMGAKGIAELPTIVIAPAVANAVYNAIGIRFRDPPLTPEKVARAIWQRDIEKAAAE
ncbi:MAG TPA: xanthine dehydrogenase family protein molybdopterin-binding subunit [Rhodospirillales bacterium]|nr:xanthine dehydrogenase family protein molybdopterin-binding subunit [Rhodospirillales bacterium]